MDGVFCQLTFTSSIITVSVARALLVGSARHVFRSTTDTQIVRVSLISRVAHAGPVMRQRAALGVRTAFDLFAVVLALGNPVGLNAVRGRRTVLVNLTFDRRMTALFVRVADRPERAEALEGAPGVVASRSRSARGGFAQVHHVATEIRISRVTRLTITHLSKL